MQNSEIVHLMMGLTGTGKTTFLAALWHVLRNSDSVPGSLRQAGVKGDRTYLNKIEQQWMSCLPLERTKISGQAVTLRIEHPVTGQAIQLAIPDMSGELYEDVQWGLRECPPEYAAMAETATGALLFLHPDETKETDSIAQVDRALDGLLATGSAEDTDPEIDKPWDSKKAPTQVKLVELLQFLLSHSRNHIHLALIISAWDCVSEAQMTPESWLSTRVPLLNQFLAANDDRITYRPYGISAQGGPLQKADELREQNNAVRRIRVVGPDGIGNDITAPIKWLMAPD